MFHSTTEVSLDGKGRVLVPASLRANLGASQKLYLWPDIENRGCIEGGGDALIDEIQATLEQLPMNDPVRDSIGYVIYASKHVFQMDQGGRITPPKSLLEKAGIDRDLVFVGRYDRIQIWSPERHAEYEREMREMAAQNMATFREASARAKALRREADA